MRGQDQKDQDQPKVELLLPQMSAYQKRVTPPITVPPKAEGLQPPTQDSGIISLTSATPRAIMFAVNDAKIRCSAHLTPREVRSTGPLTDSLTKMHRRKYPLQKKMKFYLCFSHVDSHITVLEKLASLFPEKEKLGKKHELIPFVLTCAAALECMLNDAIIEHTSRMFGHENYRRFADALTTIPLRGKLDYIIPLASNYEFLIRQEGTTYQQLASLISIRNKLTHNRTFPYELETDEPERIMEMHVPREFEEQLEPNISIDYCHSSLQALKNLAKILNVRSRGFKGWQENDTIVKNKNH